MTHSSPGRRILVATAAVLSAVLLTAGCDADPRGVLAGEDAPEMSADGALPVAPVTAGGPPVDAALVDWKNPAYRALGCSSRDEWLADGLPGDAWDAETVRATAADVTGDGRDEVLVQLTCPAAASTPADSLVVFDVTNSVPVVLGVLGEDLFHPQATVVVEGGTVTLSGPSVAGDDPYCCPGHWGTVGYAWDGARFVVRTRSEVPGTQPAAEGQPADGEHVGVLVAVAPGEVSVDVVEWFEGDDAVAACRADGAVDHGTAWCNRYYVRDADQQVLTVPVSDSASLSYLDLMTMREVAVDDVADLAGTYWVSENPEAAGYTRFRTEDGVVTALESIYTP